MIYALALQRILFYYPAAAIEALNSAGGARQVFEAKEHLRDVMPTASDALLRMLSVDWTPYLQWAERELEWCRQKNIQVLVYGSEDYPQRLLDCVDAPLVLFYRGSASLNKSRIVSIVGTRHCTPYGQDMVKQLCRDLSKACPDLLIVSGLAYGIDICAHRNALECGTDTVGVLAHGLHKIYPTAHRQTAIDMLSHGGLLTEYTSDVDGDKMNFVRRNRIVAGMADCTVVAESAAKGGSLITARIAFDYGRDVLAFPGRVGDQYSAGCINLIRENKAALITDAEDLLHQLMWQNEGDLTKVRSNGIQTELFSNLTPDEEAIVSLLRNGDLAATTIAIRIGKPIHIVSGTLFALEMRGIVKAYAGGVYHLVQ